MVASNTLFSSAKTARPTTRPTTDRTVRSASFSQEALHDTALVNRFNAGDEGAFVEIVERYREKMYSVALSVLRNPSDAEEIAQDTFIRAHRGLGSFRGDAALATWLYRIALNLSRNRYWYFFRRRRHATRSLDCAFNDDSNATFASLIASDAPSPVQQAVTGEFSELVSACMERLGAGHREILTRRNVLHSSYAEIAQALGISIGTVKSRVARARESLRLQLAKACPEFAPDAAPNEWFDPIRASGGVEAICA